MNGAASSAGRNNSDSEHYRGTYFHVDEDDGLGLMNSRARQVDDVVGDTFPEVVLLLAVGVFERDVPAQHTRGVMSLGKCPVSASC